MEIKDRYIQKASNLGFYYEQNYHGCAQSTIAAIQDVFSIKFDFVFKAASSFGGGIGRMTDGVCGGYAGAVMMISLFFGRSRTKFKDDETARIKNNKLVNKLHDKFLEKYGTVICRDIHKKLFGRTFDLCNVNERKVFIDNGAHIDKCTNVVAQSSAWCTELILDGLLEESVILEKLKFLDYLNKKN
ncbi:MAG: C-GCAxxG-C-C family protein [Eubacteriaceae bacterium]